MIVNVPPADDEQVARVPKTGEQEKKRAQAGWQSVCNGTTIGSQHSTLSQGSPLSAVVPSRASNEALQQCVQRQKRQLISQTCNNAYKDKKGSTDLSDLSLIWMA